MKRGFDSLRPHQSKPEADRNLWLWFWAAFGLVAGIRLLLVAAWAGDAPYADDINSTGWLHIYASQSTHGLPWAWLWQPHAEHRLVTQKLYSLGLAWLNGGQWDVRVEMTASALLWGGLAGALVIFGGGQLRGVARAAWVAFVVAAEGMPVAWENLLWAFQVQFVFLVGFALLALWWLTRARTLSAAWWGGLLCAAAACASQAGGLIVLPAVIGVTLLRFIKSPEKRTWREGVALGLYGGLLAAALTAVAHFEAHDGFRIKSMAHAVEAAGMLLAWPWSGRAWAAFFLWLPGVACLVAAFFRPAERSGEEKPDTNWFWFGVLVWSLGMTAATTISRGELQRLGPPPSRYTDVLVIGLLANGWVLLIWARRGWRGAVAGLWLAAAVAGMAGYTLQLSRAPTPATTVTQLSLRAVIASRPMHAEAFRDYVRTHELNRLVVDPPMYGPPEPVAEIVGRLQQAGRWPATLDRDRPHWPWLSRVAKAAGTWGWLVLLAGAGCAGWAGWRTLRRGQRRS